MTLDALRQPPVERPDVFMVQHGDRLIPTVADPCYWDARLRLLALGKPELKEIFVISDRCQR